MCSTPYQPERKPLHKAVFFFVWGMLFAIAHGQAPLYSSNQNQYFLHGLANAGRGMLYRDWLTNTADPVPLFSLLVEVTARFLDENFFHLYYGLLFAVYFYSLSGIVTAIFPLRKTRAGYLLFLSLLLFLHSALADTLVNTILGSEQLYRFHRGFAGQYALGLYFQPSTFAVFLLLSLYFFLNNRPFQAVISIAVAASFHPTYLLSGAMLVAGYLVCLYVDKKQWIQISKTAFVALVTVAPIVAYSYLTFMRVDPGMLAESQHILARIRIPFHILSNRPEWGELFYLRLSIIVAGIYFVRKTPLFAVLLTAFSLAGGLSAIQVLTDSDALGLIFPWRISVILVPLGVAFLLAKLLVELFGNLSPRLVANLAAGKLLKMAAVLITSVCVIYGLINMHHMAAEKASQPAQQLYDFVSQTKAPGDVYLIPGLDMEQLEDFRLASGAAIFADYKSIPYRADEVLEWYRRVGLLRKFYLNNSHRSEMLAEQLPKEGITHIVVDRQRFSFDLPGLQMIYADGRFELYSY